MEKYEEFIDLAAVGSLGDKVRKAILSFPRSKRPLLELLIEKAMLYAPMDRKSIAILIAEGGWK